MAMTQLASDPATVVQFTAAPFALTGLLEASLRDIRLLDGRLIRIYRAQPLLGSRKSFTSFLRRKPGRLGLGGSRSHSCGRRSGPRLVGAVVLFDVLLDDGQWGASAGGGEVGWRPEVLAAQVFACIGAIVLA